MIAVRLTSSWSILGRVAICVAMLLAPVLMVVKPVSAASPAPLAAYSFDRDSGPSANRDFFDESGNGNDCVGSSTHISMQTGHTNEAINSNSSSSYATCTNHSLQPSSEITVMAWILNISGGGYQSSLVNMPSSATTDAWGLYGGTWAQGFSGGITTTGGSAWLPSSIAQNDGQWHHLALTYDGATAKFYVDGTLTNSQALTGTITYSSTLPLQLYEDNTGMSNFQASIDDLRIYNTALSKPQVRELMSTPVSSSASHSYSRSITMSDSTPSASNVTYSTSLTADETYDIQTIIVDFCSDSPIVGETCTAPTGFSLGTPTVSNFQIGGSPVSGWTASSSNGTTLMYTGSSGTTVSPGTVVSFDITGITNPSGTGSFYARILTYSFASPGYSDTDTDSFKESGELALSTAASANFTFEVPETLTFCVYKTTCGDSPIVALGHGSPLVLSNSAVDVDSVQLSASTNAQNGVVINMKGNTLKSGSDEIPPVDGGSGATNTTITPGTAAFGMDVPTSDPNFFVNYCYRGDGTSTGYYCLYDQGTSAGIRSTYGTEIISSSGPLDNAVATLTFAATASPTTPSGQYTATFSLVATASF